MNTRIDDVDIARFTLHRPVGRTAPCPEPGRGGHPVGDRLDPQCVGASRRCIAYFFFLFFFLSFFFFLLMSPPPE